MKVVLAHSGKQHSYQVAKAMSQLGVLEKFVTSSYIRNSSLQRWLTARNDQYWSRRFIQGLHGAKVESNWRFEAKELVYARIFGAGIRTQMAVYDRDEKFDRYMANKLDRTSAELYWGFQGSSLHSLQKARKLGKLAVCELATGHLPTARHILGEEQKRVPAWADSFDHLDFPRHYYQRLMYEPEVADQVVVASDFSKRTLTAIGIAADKVKVLPLGFDSEAIPYDEARFSPYENRPLRLLYTGRVTQRKGIYYLLEAMRHFGPREVELDIIGFIHGSGRGFEKYTNRVNLLPAMSQQQLFDCYAHYDALVLPSLFEGFGLVIVEAMAAGLPVITTANSVGPTLINEGQNGFIVPIRDIEGIADAIRQLELLDQQALMDMRRKARSAAMAYTWQAYQQRLGHLLNQLSETHASRQI